MDEMEAFMGFSAFGGAASNRNKRRQQQQQQQQQQQTDTATAHASQWPPAQVVPGTELHVGEQLKRCADAKRLKLDAHGVTFLVRSEMGDDTGTLAALLRDAATVEHDGAGGDSAHNEAMATRPLPARCYKLLDELQDEKNRFDALDGATFRRARSTANPYESLGRGRFLNRSAMKLVNMDHIFRFTTSAGAESSDLDSAFTFADVCGGPGGFSEYLLWKTATKATVNADHKSRSVRGYGISLKHEICDWKLQALSSNSSDNNTGAAGTTSPEGDRSASFEISYGADGTGDLYTLANIRHFRDQVVRKHHPEGVHLVVADGGFQDARDQQNQEQVMMRLVVAEVLTMFAVLRAHGSFLCKTFELATPIMLQLVWLLHQCFAKLTVIKPITSRPASSERYLVAIDRHERLPMYEIERALEARLASPEGSSMELLFDMSVISGDACFLEFMAAASDRLALAQIHACKRINEIAEGRHKRKR